MARRETSSPALPWFNSRARPAAIAAVILLLILAPRYHGGIWTGGAMVDARDSKSRLFGSTPTCIRDGCRFESCPVHLVTRAASGCVINEQLATWVCGPKKKQKNRILRRPGGRLSTHAGIDTLAWGYRRIR